MTRVTSINTRRETKRKPKVFRMNSADWWAGFDIKSVKLAFAKDLGYSTVAAAERDRVFGEAARFNQQGSSQEPNQRPDLSKSSRPGRFESRLALLLCQYRKRSFLVNDPDNGSGGLTGLHVTDIQTTRT